MEKLVLPVSCAREQNTIGKHNEFNKGTTHMEDRAATASPADEWNGCLAERGQVDFLPRVLIAAYHDAWVVAVKHEKRVLRRLEFK
jgi:hypothetical protein